MPARAATRKTPLLSAPFTPHALPGLQLLLDARALGGADGSAVTTWHDLSGNGHDGTGGTGLTYHPSGGPGGLPRVAANGTSSGMANASMPLAPPVTIYALATPGAATGYKRLLTGAADSHLYLGVSGTNNLTTIYGDGTSWQDVAAWGQAPQQAAGTYAVISAVNDGVQNRAWYNGAALGSIPAAWAAVTGYQLFTIPVSGTQWWDGSLCLLAVYAAAHTDAQRQRMEAYLSRLSGVAVARQADFSFWRSNVNPVLSRVASTWESSDIANPDVTWDTPNARWLMNYSGFDGGTWRLGLAYSTDLLTWTKDPANPVASPVAGEGTICCNGSILWMPGASLYYHWYQISPTGGMYLMTSPDLHTWTRHTGNPVLAVGATYDAGSLSDFCVRWMPGGTTTLECFYTALDGGGVHSLARATSTDGIAWTRDKQYVQGQYWTLADLGEPSVLRDGARLRISYDWSTVGGHRKVGELVTDDGGTTFGYRSDLLLPGSGWESAQCFDSCLLLNGQTLYLFYAGGDLFSSGSGMDGQIAVATAPYATGAL